MASRRAAERMNDRPDYRPTYQIPQSSLPRTEDEGTYRYFVIIVIRNPGTGRTERIPVVYHSNEALTYNELLAHAREDAINGELGRIALSPGAPNEGVRVLDFIIATAERRV